MDAVIFTSEPMLTRALAAEIRHAPMRFLELLGKRSGDSGLASSGLSGLRCEGEGKIDVLLTLTEGSSTKTVGIEAKLDHAITQTQLDKEKSEVDLLFLLVIETEDAAGFDQEVAGVLTWREVIDCFQSSRLTIGDIECLPLQKVAVERSLRQLKPAVEQKLGPGWTVGVGRGGSGMPSLAIWSPRLSDGRVLRGQIQVSGRGMPADKEQLRFEYHVGVETSDSRTDFPRADKTSEAPGWVKHLQILRDSVLQDNAERFQVRKGHSSNGRRGVGQNKSGLVKKYLPDSPWIAAGYFDWALGPKSEQVPESELPQLANTAAELFSQWFSASTSE
ncbi:hypothetical protein [Gordonia metallireducens]|uniref:hypothetical protein n=1 Tax=Gordonia metallireducens TaxID=2897779 RepID=UPI001E4553BE|nr:hypothetical protein [Gordonia metallireducens]